VLTECGGVEHQRELFVFRMPPGDHPAQQRGEAGLHRRVALPIPPAGGLAGPRSGAIPIPQAFADGGFGLPEEQGDAGGDSGQSGALHQDDAQAPERECGHLGTAEARQMG
jgi:hypothetical protein